MKSIITKVRRKKMAEAGQTGTIAKITQIAVGSGGADAQGNIRIVSENDTQLQHELLRKAYSACRTVSDTSRMYDIRLEPDELVGENISEMMLIDEEGDPVAFMVFLPKGKDDVETVFSIEDSY